MFCLFYLRIECVDYDLIRKNSKRAYPLAYKNKSEKKFWKNSSDIGMCKTLVKLCLQMR